MFQLYRFSPITNERKLLEVVHFLHVACFQLCKQSVGKYLPVSGNVGVFCHYEKEYKILSTIREKLTEPSEKQGQKYFKLHQPVVIAAKDGVPGATYTHLYIRKPDPYRAHVGDIDFILDSNKYASMKQSLLEGAHIQGARVFERPDLDMIELYDPDVDALGYISTKRIAI